MKIEITESEKGLLKVFLQKQEADLEKALLGLDIYVKLLAVRELMKKLDGNVTLPPMHENLRVAESILSSSDYNKDWSASKKAEFLLANLGEGMTTTQIVNAIIDREPGLNRDLLVSNLSNVLGTKSKNDKMFYRTENFFGEYVYHLLEWKENKIASEISDAI